MIGRHNAARLKSVVFSGAFEVASSYSSGWMGFAQLLSVYTVVMSNVCPNLNRITLHKQLGGLIWKIEQPEDEGKTKDERVSEVVEKLVNGLPQLKELHLGSLNVSREYRGRQRHNASGLSRDQSWGTSIKWIEFVEERASLEKTLAEGIAEVEANEEVDHPADKLASTI